MLRRLFKKLNLIKTRQPHLPQANVSGCASRHVELRETWQLLGTPYRPRKYTLMQNTMLGDKLQVSHNGIYEGIVTLINVKGVGLYTDGGYKFVKWCNVLSNHCR